MIVKWFSGFHILLNTLCIKLLQLQYLDTLLYMSIQYFMLDYVFMKRGHIRCVMCYIV